MMDGDEENWMPLDIDPHSCANPLDLIVVCWLVSSGRAKFIGKKLTARAASNLSNDWIKVGVRVRGASCGET
jgi:hypothetical protein